MACIYELGQQGTGYDLAMWNPPCSVPKGGRKCVNLPKVESQLEDETSSRGLCVPRLQDLFELLSPSAVVVCPVKLMLLIRLFVRNDRRVETSRLHVLLLPTTSS